MPLAVVPAARAHEDPGSRIDVLSRRIEAGPADAELHLQRADLYRMENRWLEAVADLQNAKRLDPDLDEVDLALARVLLGAGNLGPALDAADRYLAAHPDHGGAHLLRARILTGRGDAARAVEAFDRGIALSAGHGRGPQPDDYLERARLQACEGGDHLDDAIRGLDEGLASLGAPVTLQLRAVDLEMQRRNWDGALERLAAIEARAHRKEAWMARRGDVLLAAGRPDDARRAYEASLEAIDALPARLRSSGATSSIASGLRRNLAASPADMTRTVLPDAAAASGPASCAGLSAGL